MEKNVKILISRNEIDAKINTLANKLMRDYENKNPIFIVILKGAFIFASELLLKLNIPLNIDFMVISSYGNSTQTSGTVRIEEDINIDIKGRNVVIIEDIIDTGITLKYLKEKLLANDPNSLKIITLLDKPSRRKVDINPDYNCFAIEDYFVVGFGLDYAQYYRNLPYIGILMEGSND